MTTGRRPKVKERVWDIAENMEPPFTAEQVVVEYKSRYEKRSVPTLRQVCGYLRQRFYHRGDGWEPPKESWRAQRE